MVGVHELHWSGWGKGHVQAVINTIRNLWVPYNVWNLLNSWTFCFSGMTLLHVVGWSVVPCFYEGLPACLIFWGAQPPAFPCPALFLLLLVDHTVSTITTSAVNFICNILGMTEDCHCEHRTLLTVTFGKYLFVNRGAQQRCLCGHVHVVYMSEYYTNFMLVDMYLMFCICMCVCMYVECSEFVFCKDYVEV